MSDSTEKSLQAMFILSGNMVPPLATLWKAF